MTKQLVLDITGYTDEVAFLIQNKHLLKKEVQVEVTEAFSKMPENASDFKVVQLKKRPAPVEDEREAEKRQK